MQTSKDLYDALVTFYKPDEANTVDIKTLRFVLYARKSTTSDERQERSISDQKKDCLDAAKRLEIPFENINELGMKTKLEDEIKRFSHFQRTVFGSDGKQEADEAEVNIRVYAKYLLRQGSVSEKRELLGNLRSRLVYLNRKITLLENGV